MLLTALGTLSKLEIDVLSYFQIFEKPVSIIEIVITIFWNKYNLLNQ